MPALRHTEDHLARIVLKVIPAQALAFTWELVRDVSATVTPAAVTLTLGHVCNAFITLLAQGVTTVKLVTMETLLEVMLRLANPVPVLELHQAPNSQKPATWTLMGSLHATTVPLVTLAVDVKDVLKDTLVTHCLDRGALVTIH